MKKTRSYRRRRWAALLAALLLVVGVSGAFRAGVRYGYRWGAMQVQGEDEAAPAPRGPGFRGTWGPGYWGWPMRHVPWGGGFLGRFLGLLLVLLGLGALFKVFRFKAWHAHRAHSLGPIHGVWGDGHPWGHGPSCCGGHPGEPTGPGEAEAPAEEQVAKVRPEPDAG